MFCCLSAQLTKACVCVGLFVAVVRFLQCQEGPRKCTLHMQLWANNKNDEKVANIKFFAEHTISFLIQNKTISMAVLLGAALQPPEYFDSLWLGSGSRCDQRLWHMFYYVIVLCC